MIVEVFIALIVAIGGALALDRIRGVPRRAKGGLERALQGIPGDSGRERWREELSTVLLESEGRPLKQFREGRELIRAAESLAAIYATPPLAAPPAIQLAASLESLSYRERRVLELRYGLGGESPRTLDDIGRTFYIPVERVREIERVSLAKLEDQTLRDVAD